MGKSFLSCAVGGSPDFVQKIADDWNTEVAAFKRKMVMDLVTTTAPGKKPVVTVQMYLFGKQPTSKDAQAQAEIYTPGIEDSPDTFLAKPGGSMYLRGSVPN